jgi:hypothetical protein
MTVSIGGATISGGVTIGDALAITTEGLVLSLDAGSPASYPGTGTTWTDLSGSVNTGTLFNSPVYSSANGGYLDFDGIDDYIVSESPGTYSNYTFAFFCKWNSPVTYDRIFGLSNFGTYTILSPTNVGFHYNPLGGSPPSVTLSSNVNVGYGNWCQVAVTVNASGNSVIIYINGIARNSWSTLPSDSFSGNFFLGSQNTFGLVSNCNIGVFSLYNTVLSESEMLQNYNAYRGRYGI